MNLLEQARCVVAMMEKVPAAGDALLPEVRDLFADIHGLRSLVGEQSEAQPVASRTWTALATGGAPA